MSWAARTVCPDAQTKVHIALGPMGFIHAQASSLCLTLWQTTYRVWWFNQTWCCQSSFKAFSLYYIYINIIRLPYLLLLLLLLPGSLCLTLRVTANQTKPPLLTTNLLHLLVRRRCGPASSLSLSLSQSHGVWVLSMWSSFTLRPIITSFQSLNIYETSLVSNPGPLRSA